MSLTNHISTREAMEIVADKGFRSVSLVTMIQWCKKYKIGRKMGGRWFIDRDLLISFINKGSHKWNAAVEKQKILKSRQ
jgi:hypothetical protein